MFCGICGTEISNNAKFCSNCGAANVTTGQNVNVRNTPTSNPMQVNNQTFPVAKERHGFTSFFIIMGIITCSIMGIIYTIAPSHIAEFTGLPAGMLVIDGLTMIGYAVCYALLLKWKKIGWYILIGLVVINLLITIIGMGLFYLILRIKKNGLTTWEQLS